VNRTELGSAHSLLVGSLEPNTLYHFRITSKDAQGNPAHSPDQQFTTGSAGGGGTIPPSQLSSDDFDTPTLDPTRWLAVDPLLDATCLATPTHMEITAPAGKLHDAWTGSNDLPRIMRAAPDSDFDIHAKFDSPLASATGQFCSQGILIEELPGRF